MLGKPKATIDACLCAKEPCTNHAYLVDSKTTFADLLHIKWGQCLGDRPTSCEARTNGQGSARSPCCGSHSAPRYRSNAGFWRCVNASGFPFMRWQPRHRKDRCSRRAKIAGTQHLEQNPSVLRCCFHPFMITSCMSESLLSVSQ